MKTKHLIFYLLLISSAALAQNTKHSTSSGKIIFNITYPESTLDEATLSNLPKESTMYFKDDKVKVEVTMPMGKTTVISDNKVGEGLMLMDMMGSKTAIKINQEEMMKEKEAKGKTKVVNTRESKIIAGYTCMKAIVTVETKDGDKSFDAWFTNEIKVKNSFSSQIDGINGFLMEFFNNQNGMNMKMTARSVEPMEIADSEFNIPEGYEVKTMDELKKGMGGR